MKKSLREIQSEAIETLRSGGILLYPTDTVWGIGCDATDPEAVAKVCALKHRPDGKSLVLLVSDLDMAARYVRRIPEIALDLVAVNDRPMTLIYPGALCGAEGERTAGSRYRLAYNVAAADGSVALRIPQMDFCRDLVFRLDRPLVSTSANISGAAAPARFREIAPEIRAAADYVVDPRLEQGATGRPSQIIKLGLDGTVQVIRA